MVHQQRQSYALRAILKVPELRAYLSRLSREFRQSTTIPRITVREDFAQVLHALEVAASTGGHQLLDSLLKGAAPALRRDFDTRRVIPAITARIRRGSRSEADGLPTIKQLADGLSDEVRMMLVEKVSLDAIADECVERTGGMIDDLPSARWSKARRRDAIRSAVLRLKKKADDPNAIVRATLRSLLVPKQDVDSIFKFEAQRARREKQPAASVPVESNK